MFRKCMVKYDTSIIGLLYFVTLRAAIAATLTMAVVWSSSLSEPNKAQGSAAIVLLRLC